MNAKAKIGEVLLILGIGLFVGGAICYITGQLPAEQMAFHRILFQLHQCINDIKLVFLH